MAQDVVERPHLSGKCRLYWATHDISILMIIHAWIYRPHMRPQYNEAAITRSSGKEWHLSMQFSRRHNLT